MAKTTNTFALGLTVIVILVLFFAVLLFIGGSGLFGPSVTAYSVRFSAAAPLPDEVKAGAAVFCGLRKVGSVERVAHRSAVEESTGRNRLFVYLDFTVSDEVELRKDCEIVARGPLLGGGGKLVITDPGVAGERLSPGATIEGKPGGTFDSALEALAGQIDPNNPAGLMALVKMELDAGNARSMLAKAHRSIDDLNAITAGISRQVDPRQKEALIAKVGAVLDNVNAATASLREQLASDVDGVVLAKVHEGLDNLNASLSAALAMIEYNRPVIDETIAGVQRTVDTLDRRIVTPVGDELDAATDRSLLAKLHVSFDRLNQSLGDVTVVTDGAREVLVLNKGRLDDIFANVSETSAHLKSASKEIRRSPWRLLYRPSLPEMKELNIFDASREFSEAAAHLDDSAAQLRALLDAHGGRVAADDPDLQKIRARLQETFEKFTVAEKALWKELSDG